MAPEGDLRHSSTLRDYLSVVRRRKWIILQAVILVPLAAVFLSLRQEKIYQAQAQVLLTMQNLADALTGTYGSDVYQDATRIAQTQANIARNPEVADRAVASAGIRNRSGYGLLASSWVSADPNSNLLYFSASDHDPSLAVRMVNAYADAYVLYKQELDTASIRRAERGVQKSLSDLRKNGQQTSTLYTNLADRLNQLKQIAALQSSNANVVRRADYAYQVKPTPLRNGVLGLALGIILGLALAFLRDALDTRVRSAEEIGDRLGLPLLARLPEPPRRFRRENRLVMVAEPTSPESEAFRMLRTNLDFVRLDQEAKTIMITSAVEAEGKSTTAANLAAALARVGQRVALVDLDLRRPYLHKFFDLDDKPGLTQVALGHAELEDALTAIPLVRPGKLTDPLNDPLNDPVNGNGGGNGRVEGLLEVLGSGPIPPNVDEFVGTKAVAEILRRLRQRSDVVIIDSTPLLVVGDAMALTASVDALLIITRANVVRRPMLRELHRVLDTIPALKLGYVVTGAPLGDGYYGYENNYRYRSYVRPSRERVR
jgi:Mrp family chromosome partitioning ATPase/capsular polysaccharide biosynthesis protein